MRPMQIRTGVWIYDIKTDDILWVRKTQDNDQQGMLW